MDHVAVTDYLVCKSVSRLPPALSAFLSGIVHFLLDVHIRDGFARNSDNEWAQCKVTMCFPPARTEMLILLRQGSRGVGRLIYQTFRRWGAGPRELQQISLISDPMVQKCVHGPGGYTWSSPALLLGAWALEVCFHPHSPGEHSSPLQPLGPL